MRPGCGGVGRRLARRGWARLGGHRRGEVKGRLGSLGAGLSRQVSRAFSSRSASPEAPAEAAPAGVSASGGLWEGRGSVPSGR